MASAAVSTGGVVPRQTTADLDACPNVHLPENADQDPIAAPYAAANGGTVEAPLTTVETGAIQMEEPAGELPRNLRPLLKYHLLLLL